MTKDDFRQVLSDAINGNEDALATLFELYMPLINRYSYVDGMLDEDLRQYILLHIFEKFGQFEI